MAVKSLNLTLGFDYNRVQTIASPSEMAFPHLVVHAVFKLAPCLPRWGIPSQLEEIF